MVIENEPESLQHEINNAMNALAIISNMYFDIMEALEFLNDDTCQGVSVYTDGAFLCCVPEPSLQP